MRRVMLGVALLGIGACSLIGVNGGNCASRQASRQWSSPLAHWLRVEGAGNTVAGDVRDAATNEPLRNASVELYPGPYKDVADSTGSFSFHGIPSGTVRVVAQRYDHLPQEVRFTLDAGAGVDVAFALQSNRCEPSVTPAVQKPGTVPRPAPPRIP